MVDTNGNNGNKIIIIIEEAVAISSILFYLSVLYMLIKKLSSKAFLTIIKIELVLASIFKAAFYLIQEEPNSPNSPYSTSCKIQVFLYEFSSFSCLLLGTAIPLIIYINITCPGIIDRNQSKFHCTLIVICWLLPVGLASLLFALSYENNNLQININSIDNNCEIKAIPCVILDIVLNFLIFLFMLILFCKIQRTLKQSYNDGDCYGDQVLKEYLSHFSKYIYLIVLCLVYIIAYTVSGLILASDNYPSANKIIEIIEIVIELLIAPCLVLVFTFKPEMLHCCCTNNKRESLNSKLLSRQEESAMFEMERTNQSTTLIAEL